MVKITKQEAMKIREAFPNAKIFITSKNKPARARTYYLTEESRVMRALDKIRGKGE